MDPQALEQKMAQFHEFFTIKHQLNVNLIPKQADFVVPDESNLEQHMPYAFQIAAEMSSLETQALRPLRNLGEHAQELAEYLNHQTKKIDLMMSFILQQQDELQHRMQSTEFGGGGLVVFSPSQQQEGLTVELKIFLSEEAAGVFCFAEVVQCKPVDGGYHTYLLFNCIREQDQELLVRASLHLQTLQLRARAKQQQNDKK